MHSVYELTQELNDITSQSNNTSEKQYNNIHFIDMVQEFEGNNFFITGEKHFYEHVHLTMEGNYQIAICFADKIESLFTLSIA